MHDTKKRAQLGMPIGTASNRLLKDLLFKLALEAGYRCHRCSGELDRKTLSVEHKEPWLDSDDPVGRFFDLENIGFSHRACNIGAARKPNKKYLTKEDRLEAERAGRAARMRRAYTKEKRQAKWRNTGY